MNATPTRIEGIRGQGISQGEEDLHWGKYSREFFVLYFILWEKGYFLSYR